MASVNGQRSAAENGVSAGATGKKSIVVVGGGGAGTILLRRLLPAVDPAKHEVTLITARPFTIFLPPTVRMAVTNEGGIEQGVMMPYDRLLGDRGKLVVGTAVGVEVDEKSVGGWVVLKDGDKVRYDVLVLAPGTRLDDPLDFPEGGEKEVKEYVEGWRKRCRDAREIVMAGGGPINVEIAGELKEYFPDKKVTIVQSRALPFNDIYKANFRRRVLRECQAAGIDFVFEDHLDQREPVNGHVTTRKGHTLRADLVIASTGGKPNTSFLSSLGHETLAPSGHVNTRPTLELAHHDGIFVLGDVLANGERNRLGKYPRHAAVVVPNVLARLEGREPTKTYEGSVETLRVSIGKDRAVIYFGVLWGICIGGAIARKAQSRDLLLPKGRRIMGYKDGGRRKGE